VTGRPPGLDDGDDVGTGDITAVRTAAGSGLLGGVEDGEAALSVDFSLVAATGHGHAWTEMDGRPPGLDDGDDVGITSIETGEGLTGGPIAESGTLAVDATVARTTDLDALRAQLAELRAELADASLCPRLRAYHPSGPPVERNYVPDATTPGIVVCRHGSDEMVKVGDSWIDRYEAILVRRGDFCDGRCDCGTGRLGAGVDDYPPGFPDDGNWSEPVHACSVRGSLPSGSVTWFQAQQACALAGKRLCTNAEWQAAVAGTVDPGGDNPTVDGACNTAQAGPRGTAHAGGTPGGTGSCVSRWGAEDMIGNLVEWVDQWGQAGLSWQVDSDSDLVPDVGGRTPWPADYGDGGDTTHNVNGRVSSPGGDAGTGAGWAGGMPFAGLRGGSWNDGREAGAFHVNWSNSPASTSSSVGVRCCAGGAR
jgi:formylglycine-generating enzyme required for sulfatase activity